MRSRIKDQNTLKNLIFIFLYFKKSNLEIEVLKVRGGRRAAMAMMWKVHMRKRKGAMIIGR